MTNNDNVVIYADKPLMVAQYAGSATNRFPEEGDDPAMVRLLLCIAFINVISL